MICHSQDFEKKKVLSIFTSPGSWSDGFSLGAQFEYKNKTIYVGPELYAFPELHNLPYYHLIGRFGLNHHLGYTKHWARIYAGGRAGAISRDRTIQALLGLEAGFDIRIFNTDLYTGLSGTSDMKTDSKVYSNDDHHTVNSVLFKIGLNF